MKAAEVLAYLPSSAVAWLGKDRTCACGTWKLSRLRRRIRAGASVHTVTSCWREVKP